MHPWIFGRQQWHLFLRYVTRLRVPKAGDLQQVVRPSVLELYLSYLLCHGEWRFQTGTPDHMHGGRIANQLCAFAKAWRSFAHLANAQDVMPAGDVIRDRMAPTSEWGGCHGMPRFVLISCDLLLPKWRSVGRLLQEGFNIAAGALRPGLSSDCALWRRWEPGIPDSQQSLKGAGLNCTPLVCETPPVWRRQQKKKFVPRWQLQHIAFARWQAKWPVLSCLAQTYSILDGLSIQEWVLSQGALDRNDVHAMIVRWSNVCSLAKRLRAHNVVAVLKPMHVFDSALSFRWACARCRCIGYLSPRWAWMRQQCILAATWHLPDAQRKLEHEEFEARIVMAALADLYRRT